jgi:hypothetical protein
MGLAAMTDIWLPDYLRQAQSSVHYIDATGSSRGTFTGALRTNARGGDRLGATIRFTPHGGPVTVEASNRAILRSFLASLRGKQNRVYLSDGSYRRRGSMPTGELLANNTFANGIASWNTGNSALTASDRVMRVTATVGGANFYPSQTATAVQYAPYIFRAFATAGRDVAACRTYLDDNVSTGIIQSAQGLGLISSTKVALTTTLFALVFGDSTASTLTAGSYFQLPYTSISRCALVDAGMNLLQRSDEIDNAYWTKTNVTVTGNTNSAPDGLTTADLITETTATGGHYVNSTAVTVSSAVAEYSFSVALNGTRSWAFLQITENTGVTSAVVYFNINTGVVGSPSIGANWSNVRAYITSMGGGYYRCTIVARKTNAATSISAYFGAATADLTSSYTGSASQTLLAWRATLAQSSGATRQIQTTNAATSGTSPTGSAMHSKGWPISTNGLLLIDDQVEIQTSRGSELKILTAPVNSDAAGLAYMQFEPPLRGVPADNAPIIVHNPMGRFGYVGDTVTWDNDPGFWTSAACELEEAPA